MKMLNNKTTATTIVAMLAIGLALLSPSTILPTIEAMSVGTPELEKLNLKELLPAQTTHCTDILTQKIQEQGMSIDNDKAKSIASTNSEFVNKTKGYTPKFNSVNIIGSYDPITCAVTWNQVNVVYALYDNKGVYVKSMYAEENPSLTQVTNFVEKMDKQIKSSTTQSQNWSGYEFYHTTMSGATQIYEAKATWNIPTITNPGYPTPGNCANKCDMEVWPGLEDVSGGGTHLVQGGSDSFIGCSTCTATYDLWYMFLTNNSPTISSTCTGFTPTAGDSLTTDIKDTTKNPMATTSNYVISFVDNTHSNGGLCGTSGTSFALNDPLYAPFIVERAKDGTSGSFEELGEWSTAIPTTGSLDWSGTLTSIYTPYSTGNGEYYFYNMTNPYPTSTYQNTIVGALTSGGTFYTLWNTSQGTY